MRKSMRKRPALSVFSRLRGRAGVARCCGLSLLLFTNQLLAATPPPSTTFKQALPGYTYSFPRDHGSHPNYATEWWYYTGHLQARDGRRFGFQLTWFRTALAPRIERKSAWAARDLMFAHFALTDESGKRFLFSDRIGRANLGLNGADANSKMPRVWCGDWQLQFGEPRGQNQTLRAAAQSDAKATQGVKFALSLSQQALKPPAIHGEKGVSQKSAGVGRASHYFSFTRLQTQGTLQIGDEKLQVVGQSWFDHEFGSGQMASNQVGWDWFSLQLSDGRELMLYRLRLRGGGTEPFSSGTIVEKDGRTRHLKLSDFQLTPGQTWHSPQTGADYPLNWKVTLPHEKMTLVVDAVLPQQELRPVRSSRKLAYWEGSVRAKGQQNGKPITAQGYLEMTGYAQAFGSTF